MTVVVLLDGKPCGDSGNTARARGRWCAAHRLELSFETCSGIFTLLLEVAA